MNAWRLATLWRRTFDGNIELYTLALITALTATVVVGARVVLKVQDVGRPDRAMARPGRRPAPARWPPPGWPCCWPSASPRRSTCCPPSGAALKPI